MVVCETKEYVIDVAPGMSVQDPPGVNACHCTDGEGLPHAAAVKVAVSVAFLVMFDGLCDTSGAYGETVVEQPGRAKAPMRVRQYTLVPAGSYIDATQKVQSSVASTTAAA